MFSEALGLSELLEEEVRLVETLLDVAERKRRAIIGGETAQLAALNDDEEIVLAQLQAAERARVEAAAKLARCLDLPESARLERFEAALEGSARPRAEGAGAPGEAAVSRLREAAGALRQRAQRLSRANRHNGELLAECLAHVAGFFRMLTHTAVPEPGLYAPEGGGAAPAALRLVDKQA